MGLFDIFKKEPKTNISTTENGILGPTYFDGLTKHIDNPKDLHSTEWRRKLVSKTGNEKFKIKYYGQLHDKYTNLIVGTEFSRALIYAVDIENNIEILLFDGCKHGYDPIFCDTFSNEQISTRNADKIYKDNTGNEIFEIVVSTYNNFDFDEEMGEEVDENGFIELDNGTKIKLEYAKRNGFDTFQIWATNNNGQSIEIVSEELA
jgi:hypothetical protein